MAGISLTKRTTGLFVALILAALATAALVSYVRGVENKALEGVETVQVYVAKESIPAGTSAGQAVSAGLIGREAVPRKVAAEGAVGSLEEIDGKVAAVAILRGEQIVASRWILASQLGSTLPIPKNHVAMAIQVGVPPAVAGFIAPGSRVSVLANVDTGDDEGARTQFLLQNVQVLAVGNQVVTTGGAAGDDEAGTQQAATNDVLLTLALTPNQAEQLGYVIFQGSAYFALLPPDGKPAGTPGRTAETLFR